MAQLSHCGKYFTGDWCPECGAPADRIIREERVAHPIAEAMTTTGDQLAGHHIAQSFGVVSGVGVRGPGPMRQIKTGLKDWVGGDFRSYAALSRETQAEALLDIRRQAAQIGANGLIGVRMVTSTPVVDLIEVLVYGTAVTVAKD